MSNSIRSESYSESVKRGFYPLTPSPIQLQQQRSTTSKKSFHYPPIPESHTTISARMFFSLFP